MNCRAPKSIPWDGEIANIKRLHLAGLSISQIAKRYEVSTSALKAALRRREISLPRDRKAITPAEARQRAQAKAVSDQARKARKEAEFMRKIRHSETGLISFSALKRIDDLIGNGWCLPFAFEEITGRTYAGGVR
ncbi:MAG: hypothetical protein ABF617_08135 [Gluconobacter japonicus]|uniref:hypothetical protein n=1 Tax=Gluconobacter japonicus TaxID=376620 RepID=UPI0039EBFF04